MTKWWMILGYFLVIGGVLNIPSGLWTYTLVPVAAGLFVWFLASLPLLKLVASIWYDLFVKKA